MSRTAEQMAHIFAAMFAALLCARLSLSTAGPVVDDGGGGSGIGGLPRWLPAATRHPAKRATELWFLCYSAVWISAFAIIIASGVYLTFSKLDLMICFLPFFFGPGSDEGSRRVPRRHVGMWNVRKEKTEKRKEEEFFQ